ncbi:hypothetical protein OE903_23255 [Bacillus sp. B6(2022)]|nr:hypothetical protein [Bacillus sp. B6(2022)]
MKTQQITAPQILVIIIHQIMIIAAVMIVVTLAVVVIFKNYDVKVGPKKNE